MDDWANDGGWDRLPDSFHATIGNLQTKYLPADGAYLDNGSVLVRGSDDTRALSYGFDAALDPTCFDSPAGCHLAVVALNCRQLTVNRTSDGSDVLWARLAATAD